MSALFVDDPTWAYVILAALAVIFVVVFFMNKRVFYLALMGAMGLIALGFWLLDRAVETDREQVIRKTQEIAADAQRGDDEHFATLISNDFYWEAGVGSGGTNREQLLVLFRRYLPSNEERQVSVWSTDVRVSADKRVLTTTSSAHAQGGFGGFQVPAWLGTLDVTFMKDADGEWRARKFRIVDQQGREIREPR